MARWVEAQSPAGTYRLVNVDVAARVDFMFLDGNAEPFLARVYSSLESECNEVIEPAAAHLYAYMGQSDQQIPGAPSLRRARESTAAPTTLSDRLSSESGDGNHILSTIIQQA